MKNRKAFTLIELMVVMAIIAILAVLIIGAVQLARKTATETTHRSNGKTVQTALEGNFARAKVYCGNTGGPACAAATFAATATTLGVNLASASECSGNYAGGGRVSTLTASSYVIEPGDSNCGHCTDVSDILSIGVTPAPSACTW